MAIVMERVTVNTHGEAVLLAKAVHTTMNALRPMIRSARGQKAIVRKMVCWSLRFSLAEVRSRSASRARLANRASHRPKVSLLGSAKKYTLDQPEAISH